MIVDNVRYNDVCVNSIKESLIFHKTLYLNGHLFHVRCYAHIFNIIVHYGLSDIKGIIENVRESVRFIGASEAHLNSFKEIATQLKLLSKKLVLDCCTRWKATLLCYHLH